MDAWSCFRDGFVDSSVFPSAQTKRPIPKPRPSYFEEEPKATIYGQEFDEGQVIVAVEHELLHNFTGDQESSRTSFTSEEPETLLPLVVASPILEEGEGENDESNDGGNRDVFDFGASAASLPVVTGGNSQISISTSSKSTSPSATHSYSQGGSPPHSASQHSKAREETEILTASMQSLVDGLMNWGGQIDEEDFTLPTGMAASIVLEGSNNNF